MCTLDYLNLRKEKKNPTDTDQQNYKKNIVH